MKIALKEIQDLGDEVWGSGWAFPSKTGDEIKVTLTDSNGKDPYSVIHVAAHEEGASRAYPDQPEGAYTFTFTYDAETSAPVTLACTSVTDPGEVGIERISEDFELIRKPELRMLRKTVRIARAFVREKNKKEFLKALLRENPYLEALEYGRWLKANLADESELKKQSETNFSYMPLISIIVSVNDPKPENLTAFIESVRKQSYENWQLCIANGSGDNKGICKILHKYAELDTRIKNGRLRENRGIAGNLNAALKMAEGEWIAVAGQEDVLSPDILFQYVLAINADKDTDMLYCDEDCFDEKIKMRRAPLFKPDFNIDFLTCSNYMRNMIMVKRTVMDEAGKFNSEYDKVWNYDMNLRLSEKSRFVKHVPMVLYSRRGKPFETGKRRKLLGAPEDEASRAINDHFERAKIPARATRTQWKACYRTDFTLTETPLVSVLIPNKDHSDDLKRCIDSIINGASYQNYEIIIIENNSTEPETFKMYDELMKLDKRIRLVTWEKGFNYSAINNYAVQFAKGDYLLLLNNDTEIITTEIFESMLGYCMRKDVGAVGAKLLYDDNTVQHAGVLIGVDKAAHHVFLHYPENDPGYMGRAVVSQDMSGVTAACLMVRKDVYLEVGGMDEDFVVAYNDVDFCLKLDNAGYLNVFDAFVFLYHYESKSRGFDLTPEAKERFEGEKKRLIDKWPERILNDPYYNKNLSLKHGYYRI